MQLSDYQVDASLAPDAGTCGNGSVCDPSTGAAAIPTSKQCPVVYGASADPRSVRIGAVFDLSGPESAIGALQAHSSELAIEQINSAGGITLRAESEARPLTLIICDRAKDAHEALTTLVKRLGVRAIVGPAWTQSFASVAADAASFTDAMLLGPSALSEAVRGGGTTPLTWGMTLSEADRVPMLLSQLRALATQLRQQPRPLELALVMRADGPMSSVRISQAQIAPVDHGPMIDLQQSVVSYEYRDGKELTEVAAKLAANPPDIIIADGASEVAGDLIAPLERMLAESNETERPYYLLSESAQVPELLLLGEVQPQLQPRLSVIGALPTEDALPVYAQFEAAYRERYGEGPRAVTGVAATYSAVYAFAYGSMAASDDSAGPGLAQGLRQLTGGALDLTTTPADVSKLSDALENNQAVSVTGAFGPLSWTDQGSPRGAQVGVYCLGRTDDGWSFVSTGYRYNIASGALGGSASPCAMWEDTGATGPAQGKPARAANGGSQPAAASDMDAGAQPPVGPGDGAPAADAGEPAAPSGGAAVLAPLDIGLRVQYYPLNNSPYDSVIGPAIKIVNVSASEAIPLCSLTARYYLTNEHADRCPQDCTIDGFYSGLQPSGMTTPSRRSYHEAGPDSSSAYLEIAFPCTPLALGVGDSVEVQQQFHTEPYADFDESDDYSFRLFPTSYADTDYVTLYRDGRLVWGTPPL